MLKKDIQLLTINGGLIRTRSEVFSQIAVLRSVDSP